MDGGAIEGAAQERFGESGAGGAVKAGDHANDGVDCRAVADGDAQECRRQAAPLGE